MPNKLIQVDPAGRRLYGSKVEAVWVPEPCDDPYVGITVERADDRRFRIINHTPCLSFEYLTEPGCIKSLHPDIVEYIVRRGVEQHSNALREAYLAKVEHNLGRRGLVEPRRGCEAYRHAPIVGP